MTTGIPAAAEIVPTADIKAILQPHINRLAAELPGDPVNGRKAYLKVIARRVAVQLQIDEPTALKRLKRVLYGNTKTTTLDIADAILLSVGTEVSFENVPVLPNGIKAAREMATVWYEIRDLHPEPLEVEQLAASLARFSAGFLKGLQLFTADDVLAA